MSLPRQLLRRIARKHWGFWIGDEISWARSIETSRGLATVVGMFSITDNAGRLPPRPHRAGALTTCLMAYAKWRLLAAVKSVLAPALSGCAPETRGQMCPNVLKCAKSVPIAPAPLEIEDVCPYACSTMTVELLRSACRQRSCVAPG